MTYSDVIGQLDLGGICVNPRCGLSARAHRRGAIFLDVVHWHQGPVNRRGLRRFLLLVAKRDRLIDPGFLNSPDLWWAHMYLDERKANQWAAQLGVRFPIAYSAPERRSVSLVPGLSRRHKAVWQWARRGAA